MVDAPSAIMLALVLMVFGYGQGLVMAPLSGAVLSTVKPASAGSGSGMYGTTAQIATRPEWLQSARCSSPSNQPDRRGWHFSSRSRCLMTLIACAAFLAWMRRASRDDRLSVTCRI